MHPCCFATLSDLKYITITTEGYEQLVVWCIVHKDGADGEKNVKEKMKQ
jgi:hypothetical protein